LDISESKVPCTLRFFEEGGRGLVAGPLDAVLHLFEHRYHPLLLPFGYGAAEVPWNTPSFLAAFAKTPVHRPVVQVALADGRRGRAIAFAGFGDQPPTGELLVVGLARQEAQRTQDPTIPDQRRSRMTSPSRDGESTSPGRMASHFCGCIAC
jgi:hypothetical protein